MQQGVGEPWLFTESGSLGEGRGGWLGGREGRSGSSNFQPRWWVCYVSANVRDIMWKQREGKHNPWPWMASRLFAQSLATPSVKEQRHHHQRACWNAESQAPPQDFLNQNLNFNKIPREFVCTIKFEKSWPKRFQIWSCHIRAHNSILISSWLPILSSHHSLSSLVTLHSSLVITSHPSIHPRAVSCSNNALTFVSAYQKSSSSSCPGIPSVTPDPTPQSECHYYSFAAAWLPCS